MHCAKAIQIGFLLGYQLLDDRKIEETSSCVYGDCTNRFYL